MIGTGARESLPPPAWSFGDNPRLADTLLAAVLSGAKTATSSSLWEYDDGETPVPEKGELSILLDGAGHPRALIRTTSVEVVPFGDVGADFALAEGEGDTTGDEWREGHRGYFSRVLERDVPDDMPVVCERFELRYPR
ncbi:ASCH domain-containing protein [Cellulosimicrobium sp. CUA-896]|uniref:ASCH domain-containing protein n=1 Tax=Cellulosimicrobium sp. CUA-896 TaxID=1517881 RepID=UPI000A889C04|nr:ASCH domain-containing protein [Cellulosimicrobium sp. CUA-896]